MSTKCRLDTKLFNNLEYKAGLFLSAMRRMVRDDMFDSIRPMWRNPGVASPTGKLLATLTPISGLR
jgi:hypothetical protein